jgi:DNA-binding GntR family transcriptional regulator
VNYLAGKLSKVNLYDYKPLREVIFTTLRDAIIAGELKPGERLMEVQLAEKMGVSRTPVREAIRKLELEGLVDMEPRKGARVAVLSAKDIIDVLEVRATLDGLATSLAAVRITDTEIIELRHVLAQLAVNLEKENLQGSIRKDIEFHEIIYRAAKNDKLLSIINNLREQVHRFRVIYMKEHGGIREIIREHTEICDAIEKKDPEKAGEAARVHIKNQETAIIKALSR